MLSLLLGLSSATLAAAPAIDGLIPEHGEQLQLPQELAVQTSTLWRGRQALRLQQLHQGVPVRGAGVVLKLQPDGRVQTLSRSLRDSLTVSTTPTLPMQHATELASAHGQLIEPPQLQVLPDVHGGQLVYSARVFTPRPLSSWRVTVDAHTGQLLERRALRVHAQGNIYEENPTFGDPVPVEIPYLEDEQNRMRGDYAMVRAAVFDEGNGSMSFAYLARPDEQGDFLYEPDPLATDDAFAEVHTYVHITRLAEHFELTHGHDFGALIQVITNYREEDQGEYSNAFMTLDSNGAVLLAFGQGYVDFSYDADVVAHELGHAVIYGASIMDLGGPNSDEYGPNILPDALHEGLADYWAASWFGNSLVGEYYGGRDLDNSNTCPDDLVEQSHEDGKIIGAAMWDMWQVLGAERSDAVVYAMLGQLSASPTFLEVAEVTVALIQDLVDDGQATAEELAQVQQAMQDRGMTLCGRALAFSQEQPLATRVKIGGRTSVQDEERCQRTRDSGIWRAPPFQFVFTTPPADQGPLKSVTVGWDRQLPEGGEFADDALQYRLYARQGELVTFDYDIIETNRGDRRSPVGADFDLLIEDMPEQLKLVPGDGLSLPPDTPVYLALTHLNCATMDLTLTLTAEVEAPVVEEPEPEGCGGCAGGSSGANLVGLLLGAALLRRRRR